MVRFVTALLVLIAANPLFAQETKRKPNILFIMSDDHASAALSCYGPNFLGKFANTPNLDRIAKTGMRFTNGLVTNSICTPSRAAILTGQYSHKNGVYTLGDVMNPKTIHIAHMLRALGYQTALIGKWHLGTDPQGFDYWNIFPGQGRYIDPQLREMGTKPKELKTFTGSYSTDVVTDLSLDWLKKRDKNKPFYLCCHYKAPHRPWDPAPRFKDLYKNDVIPEPPNLLDHYENRSEAAKRAKMRVGENMNRRDLETDFPKDLKGDDLRKWAYQIYMKRYLACVAAVDENVGRILDWLDREGLTEDTIVIYTADQGFFLGEHGWFDKRFMYEECLTAPLLIRYPPLTRPGSVNTDMVMNIDHAPTFLELAGGKIPDDMDGKSYVSILKGKTPADWRKSMYYRYWMHLDGDHNVTGHYGVRTDRYTLIFYYGKGLGMKGANSTKETVPEWELFDRQKDPREMRNVYGDPAYQQVVSDLKTELERLRAELKESK
jgi:arylsulfatase A-like enzyme